MEEGKTHTHSHTHEVTLGGRPVHEDITHVHSHIFEMNEHHHFTEEPEWAKKEEGGK